MEIIPNEILCHILSYCSPVITSQVCKKFLQITKIKDSRNAKNIHTEIVEILHNGYFHLLPFVITENNKEFILDKLALIAEKGDFSTFLWAKELGCFYDEDIPFAALKGGNIDILYHEDTAKDPRIINYALENNLSEVLSWALSKHCPCDRETLHISCKMGNMDMVKRCTELLPCKDNKALSLALRNNKKDVVVHLLEKEYYIREDVCVVACRNLDFLKKIKKEKNIPWHPLACAKAAKRGNLEILKWLRKHKCPWNEFTCSFAAYYGHLEILKWARENGCRWNEGTCNNAALAGHLEILEWARENGCPWSKLATSYSALKGHTSVLRWLLEKDCPFDKNVCINAIKGGHLETLKMAINMGCPLTPTCCQEAAKSGNWPLLLFLLDNKVPLNALTASFCVKNIKIFKQIIEGGCPINHVVWENIIIEGNLYLLQWLLEKENPQCNLLDMACKHGNLTLVSWLMKNHPKYSKRYNSAYAARSGHLHILKYLVLSGCKFNSHTVNFCAETGNNNVLSWILKYSPPLTEAACTSAMKGNHLNTLVLLRKSGCPWNNKAEKYLARKS